MSENSSTKDKDILFALLTKHGARPSPAGEEWAQDNWFKCENIVDRIYSLQHDAKYKLGRNKTILCSVLGACLSAAIETHFKRVSEERAEIESLQKQLEHERNREGEVIESLQDLVEALQKQLEQERNQKYLLEISLAEEQSKNSKLVDSPKETGGKETYSIKQIYPQKELAHMQNCGELCCSNLRPLVKTEFNCINEEVHDPYITTKETPYTATELAKLKKEYSRLSSESETEYVFRVSLTGGDQIKLSEQEASGYWGHGVFLTTGNTRAPWSLTQRAAHWAGGLSPLERGDPLAIVGTPDQLLENIHKTACLQMIHERKLISDYESPMQQPVKPEIMTPLIRGLLESLKPTVILFQKTIASTTPVDRLERFLGHTSDQTGSTDSTDFSPFATPSTQSNSSHNSGKYGPVKHSEDRPEKPREVRHIASPNKKLEKEKQISNRQQLWLLGLKRGLPREVMDKLPYDKLVKIKLLLFEATAHQALGPIHPTDPFQAEWGFATSGLSLYIWQRGPEGPIRSVSSRSCGFKDAEKRYTTWEKGLFVVSLALIEVEKIAQQQPIVLRGPFKVKSVTTGTPPPAGVAERTSVRQWSAQIEHYCNIFSITKGAVKNLALQEAENLDSIQDKPASVITPPFSPEQPANPWFTDPSAFCLTASSIIPSLWGPSDSNNPARHPGQSVLVDLPTVGEVPLVQKTPLNKYTWAAFDALGKEHRINTGWAIFIILTSCLLVADSVVLTFHRRTPRDMKAI